ncbi:unnamed protein product [Moneuplotes crassus]|uniref:Zinc finger PHD-type domain-containing protein n=1 Tax=Euplotes crassus TaxID=5936 RepID=A0AAD1XPI9_EUPCR|nr:unnamed protein product [Moneuplotes crassus]
MESNKLYKEMLNQDPSEFINKPISKIELNPDKGANISDTSSDVSFEIIDIEVDQETDQMDLVEPITIKEYRRISFIKTSKEEINSQENPIDALMKEDEKNYIDSCSTSGMSSQSLKSEVEAKQLSQESHKSEPIFLSDSGTDSEEISDDLLPCKRESLLRYNIDPKIFKYGGYIKENDSSDELRSTCQDSDFSSKVPYFLPYEEDNSSGINPYEISHEVFQDFMVKLQSLTEPHRQRILDLMQQKNLKYLEKMGQNTFCGKGFCYEEITPIKIQCLKEETFIALGYSMEYNAEIIYKKNQNIPLDQKEISDLEEMKLVEILLQDPKEDKEDNGIKICAICSGDDSHVDLEMSQCYLCKVTVHVSCHKGSLNNFHNLRWKWFCERCTYHRPDLSQFSQLLTSTLYSPFEHLTRSQKIQNMTCILCNRRTGVLIFFLEHGFIHITCAQKSPNYSLSDSHLNLTTCEIDESNAVANV